MTRLRRQCWQSALETRFAQNGNDSGVALLTALLFMLLATGLSLALLSAILSQAVPAYTAQKNTRTVYAAQAGLQSALGQIRSVADAPNPAGDIYGDPSALPCAINGRTSADASGAEYSVEVLYFTEDPTNSTAAWRTARQLSCTEAGGITTVPRYAYITSAGQDDAIPGAGNAATGNRVLSAIYKFRVTNVNVTGGMIFNANDTFCMEAVTAAAGSKVRFVPVAQCLNTANQLWSYGDDYQLKLVSTLAGGAALGLCITDPAAAPATQHVTLQSCRPKESAARWNQLWSWEGGNTWFGQKQVIADGPSRRCLQTGAASASSLSSRFLEVRKDCSTPTGAFAPSLSVGAGAASIATHQLVNYREFGRCADVTKNIATSSFMIVYPCKQDPTGTGANLNWNHKWYYTEPDPLSDTGMSAPQQIYIYKAEGEKAIDKLCLTSPAAGGVDVTFRTCDSSLATQNWVRANKTADYTTSYQIINHEGRCLTADTSDPYVDANGSKYSKVRVTACDGTLQQKWNAPPTLVDSTFGGYREVVG